MSKLCCLIIKYQIIHLKNTYILLLCLLLSVLCAWNNTREIICWFNWQSAVWLSFTRVHETDETLLQPSAVGCRAGWDSSPLRLWCDNATALRSSIFTTFSSSDFCCLCFSFLISYLVRLRYRTALAHLHCTLLLLFRCFPTNAEVPSCREIFLGGLGAVRIFEIFLFSIHNCCCLSLSRVAKIQ